MAIGLGYAGVVLECGRRQRRVYSEKGPRINEQIDATPVGQAFG